MKTRKGEEIGGGWLVFRRGEKTGRVATPKSGLPFEHPDLDSAVAEMHRMADLMPGETFEVFHTTGIAAKADRPDTGDAT